MATTLALLYTSCTKNDLLNTTALKKSTDQALHSKSDKFDLSNIKVSFKHDMLVFETMEDYLAMAKLVSTTNSFDKKLKSIFPSFKSIEDVYFEFIESDKFKNMSSVDEIYKYKDFLNIYKVKDEIFIDPLLYLEKAKIYNFEGMVQIGEDIIKRGHIEIETLKQNDIDNYNDLRSEFKFNKSVRKSQVQLIVERSDAVSQNSGKLEQRADCAVLWCNDVASNSCSSHEYRVRGEIVIEASQPGDVLGSGARTKSYKKGFLGIWASSRDGYWLEQSGTVTTTVLLLTNNTVQTATVDVGVQSTSIGSDHTIEKISGSCCVQLINYSFNVSIAGTRWKNGVPYRKPCTI